ncbi:MAG: choice-of-anchor D domain-containing protein, partial [Terracidiphilus sp.]
MLLAVMVLAGLVALVADAQVTTANAQATTAATAARLANLPPRVAQEARFLAWRGWTRNATSNGNQPWVGAGHLARHAQSAMPEGQAQAQAEAEPEGTATWQPLGPTAVLSQSFGLVTGRISALAIDPSDTTGNTLYVGTTGGGVWRSQNADTSSAEGISFIPLTDDLSAMSGAADSSISIGALTVQPGGTRVILAGTGDPNDALDSYYGAGILRSTDGGTTWTLIPNTVDGLYSFAGEGFAGFAWSSVNTNPSACGPNPVQLVVVAAVSQAYEGTLVNAEWPGTSYEGLYYSTDGGENWCLATITDSSGAEVQGPNASSALPDGNAATSVVWNPVRKMFLAAVRYHGYYQSIDGITWTRLANQPGAATSTGTNASLSSAWCPTNPGGTGLPSCPIFRGTLAVNPQTGDSFAWTVDINNEDQGIWQDLCALGAKACANQTITFAQQWNTAALEVAPPLDTTIQNGDYNLALAAVPSGQETLLLAGDNDLWETACPYSQGCKWRNATNSTVGFCAQVGEYQHSLAWNAANSMEIFVGNDSGLWRSTDAIAESGPVCNATDAAHFQNLNGSLGSLAEVESIAQSGATPYTMMAGLGANGTAGVSSGSGATTDWPEVLGGDGGPVAIDPNDSANWYVNNQAGVSIFLGTPPAGSTPGAFNAVLNYSTDPGATTPVAAGGVATADVVRDGLSMAEGPPYAPAAFLVDPLDSAELLIATCRVWRGPANGVGWSAANAISPILDGVTGENDCLGNALIRSVAAMALPVSTALPAGGEVVYLGMYGSANGNTALAGHVLSMSYNAATQAWSAPADLTVLSPVTNDTQPMNFYGMDISSIFIDAHDPTGESVYVTVAGFPKPEAVMQTVYGSTNGGASWTALTVNLPFAPANSVVVDPQSSSTVYVATDAGVYSTLQIGSCATINSSCWSPMGSGLPNAPVVELSAAPASGSVHNLVAATYGRGIWMTPLLGAGGTGTGPATDTLSATTLTFSSTASGQLSTAQIVTLTNSGSVALGSIVVSVSGEFQQANYCTASLAANSSCAIWVQFAPTTTGVQNGTLFIYDITRAQPQTVALSGNGLAPPVLGVNPASLTFTGQTVGQPSSAQMVTISNTGGAPLANVGFQITGTSASSFLYQGSTCGATLSNLIGQNSCTVDVIF